MEDNKTYKIVDRNGKIAYTSDRWKKTRMSYKTKDMLLFFLHKKFNFPYYDYRPGCSNPLRSYNKILNNCCHNWNEKYYTVESVYINGKYDHSITVTHYYNYMILDPYDRIMNITDLAELSFNFEKDIDFPKKKIYNKHYSWDEKWARYKKRNPWIGNRYYRRMRVQQERRFAVDPMHKPFIRKKRNVHCLDPWNIEKCAVIQGTWKKLKIRKQWMENNEFKTKSKNYRSGRLL